MLRNLRKSSGTRGLFAITLRSVTDTAFVGPAICIQDFCWKIELISPRDQKLDHKILPFSVFNHVNFGTLSLDDKHYVCHIASFWIRYSLYVLAAKTLKVNINITNIIKTI